MSAYDIPKVQLILTSPPYFNLEVYSDEDTQSIVNTHSYEEWENKFLRPLIDLCLDNITASGVSAWNVSNTLVDGHNMWDLVDSAHNARKLKLHDEFDVLSSKRATRKTKSSGKSKDTTRVYKRGNNG
jgi:hypothetical protein